MKLSLWFCIGLIVLGVTSVNINAQATTPQPGDPPAAGRITISSPDEDGFVTITGAPDAVFPTAQVTVRNLYTQETVFVNAGITGSFTARLFGPGNTPFWISPAQNIPANLRAQSGSLPGGPGTIIYGALPEARTETIPVTQLTIDGRINDWRDNYPQAEFSNRSFGLINAESLYVAVPQSVPAGAQVVLGFTLNETTYELAFDPALPETALLRQILPFETDLGTLAVSAAVNTNNPTVEARIALNALNQDITTATLESAFIRDAENSISDLIAIEATLPIIPEEVDGVVYPNGRLNGSARRFSIGGVLAQGASFWNATGRVSTLTPAPGDELTLEMDLTMPVEDFPESLVGLDLIGELQLQPVVANIEGALQSVPARYSNNGWSSLQTPSGLAIDNLQGDVPLGTVRVPWAQIIRRDEQLLAGLRFTVQLPEDFPTGLYVPVFEGRAQIGDGEVFRWDENGVFGTGEREATDSLTRLPLVMNVGGVQDAPILMTLFYDDPSDGSRGVLAEESEVALSNGVHFNSPVYTLSPGEYPIEPYLLNQLSNNYETTVAPLVPLLLPGGRLNATITLPDGTVDDLQDAPILQNQASTATLDERTRFGRHSQVDVYRLVTGNAAYQAYPFEQYGEYTIELSGTLEDIYGNRYRGGGTYRIVIAEPLDVTPGVLSGAPFHIGDTLFIGGHIAPGVPAEVDIRVQVFGLDGQVNEAVFEGLQANRYGYFTAGEAFTFEAPGEYIIDYTARYEDTSGRLWAGSLRSAGIIASEDSPLIAHGMRGVNGYITNNTDAYRPAWFTTALYPPADALDVDDIQLNFPYHTGDVVILPEQAGLRPALSVQDTSERYAQWLTGSLRDYRSSAQLGLPDLVTVEELPVRPVLGGPPTIYNPVLRPDFIINDAYSYISVVRPDVSIRQMVLGDEVNPLTRPWNGDDPLNEQIGAGINGLREGDYVFLFGGTVIRNADAQIMDTSAYAALATLGDEETVASVTPPYRGSAGGPDGGPLLTVLDRDVDMFFHPTGAQPAQILVEGDTLVIAGQAAPTLETSIQVEIISPSGERRAFTGMTSPTGYYYDPANDFVVEEAGVWTVNLTVRPSGVSSAGIPEPPLPQGGLLGVFNQSFPVYVVPENAEPLTWSQGDDVDIGIPAGIPFNIGMDIPTGWTEIQSAYAVKTASYVLEAGALPQTGTTFPYVLRIAQFAEDFPNVEVTGQGNGAASADVMTLVFVISGVNANGNPIVRARQFTVFHDRLISLDAQTEILIGNE